MYGLQLFSRPTPNHSAPSLFAPGRRAPGERAQPRTPNPDPAPHPAPLPQHDQLGAGAVRVGRRPLARETQIVAFAACIVCGTTNNARSQLDHRLRQGPARHTSGSSAGQQRAAAPQARGGAPQAEGTAPSPPHTGRLGPSMRIPHQLHSSCQLSALGCKQLAGPGLGASFLSATACTHGGHGDERSLRASGQGRWHG